MTHHEPSDLNPLSQIIAADSVLLDVDVADRAALLRLLATALAAASRVDEVLILERLTAREQLGSTAVGHGIAIPHCRVSPCVTAAGVLVRTRAPVPFDAPDHRPVSVFLGLVIPTHASDTSLQILAAASMLFSDRTVRDRIRAVDSPSAVLDLLRTST